MPRLDLAGARCLVTGAGQGIGLATTRALAARGARVALVDVDGERVAAAAGARDVALVADVRDRAAMAEVVAAATGALGGLDVVVANAGVTPARGTLRRLDPDDFDRVLAINTTGVFNTVRPALEPVIAARGHVVVVASVAAMMPGPMGSPYMISKAGAEQLGRALRLELAPYGASAGVAAFGVVQTAMTATTVDADPITTALEAQLPGPLRRRITPEQAAEVLVRGIERRAARTLAPSTWRPLAWGRGLGTMALEAVVVRDRRLHELIRRSDVSSAEG